MKTGNKRVDFAKTFGRYGCRLILLFAVVVVSPACTSVFLKMYGIKSQKPVSEEEILHVAKQYKIPSEDLYKLDTTFYQFLLSLDDELFSEQKQNHYQPLQALYYNKSGELSSFQINCYAGGFPNLKWNRNGIFNTFPPQQQASVDSILPLDLHLTYLQPFVSTLPFDVKQYEYILVVYWNRIMGRQSKRLIRYVQNNVKLAPELKVRTIYVNTDDFFNFAE